MFYDLADLRCFMILYFILFVTVVVMFIVYIQNIENQCRKVIGFKQCPFSSVK